MRFIKQYLDDLLNGEGLRNVYFFTSCSHLCKGCFNSETADPNMPGSREWTEDDFLKLIEDAKKSYISGITLSGGDPFHPNNRKSILELCKNFKEYFGDSKTIWIYTGYTWETIKKDKDERWECLKYIDVLCDGPFIEHLKSPSKPWVGSENQRVIDVKKSLKEDRIILK